MIFFEHWQYVGCVKAVKVVYERCRLAKPLTVKLAPHCLCPARIGYGKVQTVGVAAVPVFRCMEMPESVFVVVRRDLRISGSSGCEEHEHKIVAAGRIRRALVVRAEKTVFVVKASPSLATCADKQKIFHFAVSLAGGLDLRCRVGSAYNCFNARGIETVFKIVLLKLTDRGNRYRSQLIQSQHRKPELVCAPQHKHYSVSALYAERAEIVCASCGCLFHILKGKAALGPVAGNMQHCKLIRAAGGKLVNNIKSKIEMLCVFEGYRQRRSALVFHDVDVFAVDTFFRILPYGLRLLYAARGRKLGDRLAGGVKHYCVELAVLSVYGYHAVGH